MNKIVYKIISGGQTGADRGGLDAAIELGLQHGGFCPKGRRAEDGIIPLIYNLVETEDTSYPKRTIRNVHSADATIVISDNGLFDKGTKLTLDLCKNLNFCKIDLRNKDSATPKLNEWLRLLSNKLNKEICINIAGPRESRVPGLQENTKNFLLDVLKF